MNRLTRVVLAIAAGVLVGGGISYASSTTSGRSAPPKDVHVAFSLRRNFVAFAKPRVRRAAHAAVAGAAATAAQPLPAQVAASFNEPAQADLNYDPIAAEAVYEQPSPSSSFGFWIVPGRDGACVVWKTSGAVPGIPAGCGPLSNVEKNGGMTEISAAEGPGGPEFVFGFIHNGAQSVTVTNADSTTVSAPVVDNAFLVVDRAKTAQSLAVQSRSATGALQTTVKQIAGR